MHVIRMNPSRFEILAMWSRALPQSLRPIECSMWATHDERLLGLVVFDPTDRDYGYIILGRDNNGRFRAVYVGSSYTTRRTAEIGLADRLSALYATGQVVFSQGDKSGTPIDLFTPQVPQQQLNPRFAALAEQTGYSPARELLVELANVFDDPDGNFVRDFQTTGFDSRLWERYLYATLVEEDFKLNRSHPQPDFIALSPDYSVAIEATTVNATIGVDGEPIAPPEPKSELEFQSVLKDYMPIKFGSPLYAKLRKQDWKKSHIQNMPYIIAIADFHGDGTMTWSGSALTHYLFGLEARMSRDKDGHVDPSYISIDKHKWGDKVIPSGFFDQPDAENISAILFTNAGTISKFNRMGALADFGDPNVRQVRQGTMFNPDPKAADPIPFMVDIDEPRYAERWADELQVFHNPNAVLPLDLSFLSRVTHHILKDGKIASYSTPGTILGSITQIVVSGGGHSSD